MQAPDYVRQIAVHGFESYQLFYWKTALEIDFGRLAGEMGEAMADHGAVISSLGVYGNPLEYDEDAEVARKSWELCLDHAGDFGCDLVCGFAGRLRGRPIHESMDRFAEVFGELAKRAESNGVRIAFENCDMGGTWEAGDWNVAHNPTAWEMMFNAVTSDSLGLEWEPCHQLISLIEPLPQLRKWVDKIFHVHGKDATVRWDVVREYGVHSAMAGDVTLPDGVKIVPQFAFHRTPGFGDTDWTDVISELRMGGFTGSIDIEGWHDPVYKGELEMTGQVHALNYLKRCRGGDFVPNPQVG
jgi:sugar phosphate isomerase/epimerase